MNKTIISLLFFVCLSFVSAKADEHKTIFAIYNNETEEDVLSEVIELNENQCAEVINASAPRYVYNGTHHGGFLNVVYSFDEKIADSYPVPRSNNATDNLSGLKIVGPCKISVKRNTRGAWVRASLKIYNTIDSKNGGQVLVLPESSQTKYKVVMESSTDLVSWKEDQPGSKDPSNKKRFFRLRAVKE